MPEPVAALRPLRHPAFRRFWAANQVSNLGGLIQAVGAAWMMTSLTSSPSMIALVQASTTLPIMLFALSAGALADNHDRRRIMVVAQGLMLATSLALAVAALAGWLTPWTLLAFTFLIGTGTALNNPSWQASVGDLVPRAELPEAVSLNAMGFNLMRSVGPALGGLIVATAGAATAFVLNALSYLPLLAALALWKSPPRNSTVPPEAFGPAVAAGVRYVAMSPHLIRLMLRGMLFGTGAICLLALLPLVARDLVQGGAFVYGVLLGGFGMGAIGGGLLNPRLRRALGSEGVVRMAFLTFGLALVWLSQGRSLIWAAPAMLLAGGSWVTALSLFNVSVQLSSPRWVVGRALAVYQMTTFGGMAAGSWVWGATAGAIGTENALIAAAAFMTLGAAAGLFIAIPALDGADLDPLGRFREPALALDLRGRSGPILVMIDYRIAPEDIPAFLDTMTERRRIRRRDGARQWVLLRDLEHPDQWTESYHVATWDDYIRHNMRRTKADAEVSDRLNRLHRGEDPPRVHRMIERQSVTSHQDVPLKDTGDHI
ncbi:MAG TPA: MFS transporter [Paracoccaceae bacterium]|nr:MFS transporter [Paracoccaceae bacterium]